MAIRARSIANLPFSGVVASIVTGLLFISIPFLTEVSTMRKKGEKIHHVLISQRRPPPPPEPKQEEKLEELKKRAESKKAQQKQSIPHPKYIVPTSIGLTADMQGTIEISVPLKQDFQVTDSLFAVAFNINEVDQKPRVIRAAHPVYPFEARQQGIEGRVTVRFVVDSTGQVREPKVAKVEPKEVEGIFDKSALAVVKKYKFRPARKGGKEVDCIVNLPIRYSLSE